MYQPPSTTRFSAWSSRILCAAGALTKSLNGTSRIVVPVAPEELDRTKKPFCKRDPRLPAGHSLNGRVVRMKVPDVDRCALGRERDDLHFERADATQGLYDLPQADCLFRTQIVHVAAGVGHRGDEDQGINNVVHIVHVAQLLTRPEHVDLLSQHRPLHEDRDEALPVVPE